MPNIYGKYSLTELAQDLKVTAAFINRIQRETGIGGPVGTKGQSTLFNESDKHLFRRIWFLRKIDCSFHDIKEIWDLENKLIGLYTQYVRQENRGEEKKKALIIHSETLYVPASSEQIKGNKKAKAYFEEIRNLGYVAKRIKELYVALMGEAKEVEKIVNELRPIEWEEYAEAMAKSLYEMSKISVDK